MSAQTYTTARGKTKKAKEGIRKDAKNNAARKIMTSIAKAAPKAQENIPIQREYLDRLRLAGGNVEKKAQLTAAGEAPKADAESPVIDALSQVLQNIRLLSPSYQRCFYTECGAGGANASYKLCANCRIARYCSPDCQKSDWRKIHKGSCNKTELLSIGSSVAIRPLDSYLSLLSPSFYPSNECKSPCNEIHGVILSLPREKTPPNMVTIEVFDADLVPTGVKLEVEDKDLVASGWRLEEERKIAPEKLKRRKEQQKHETKKEKEREAERRAEERKRVEKEEEEAERKASEKKRVEKEEEKARLKERQTLLAAPKSSVEGAAVAVDWSLFDAEVDVSEELQE